MGIRPAIVTECGQREIDNHPLVLQRAGEHGALLVMDPDGLEQPSAGEEVPRIFDLLWRNALGQETVDLGQFSAPPTHYEGMLVDLVEVAKHYDLIEDVSILTPHARPGQLAADVAAAGPPQRPVHRPPDAAHPHGLRRRRLAGGVRR